ncbi:MAG: hypothetical protein LBO04_04415 [Spirochaetaceae bacterium]|jgi:hypothetical protein|nr:hypothetical protein [Spirochaetaceae bacterium]
MKKLISLIFAGLLIAACDNPSGDSTATSGAGISIGLGSGWLSLLRVNGDEVLDALEGNNVIWKDASPSSLTLRVAPAGGWTEVSWFVDGADEPFASWALPAPEEGEEAAGPDAPVPPPVTLEAAAFRETAHKLTFTGVMNGTPHSVSVPFKVTAGRAADIVWTQTENDSSLTSFNFDLDVWTGYGTEMEAWELGAVEQPFVYFAVHKRFSQTITAGGAGAALVTKAEPGETVDGSVASDTLDVFTVDTGDILFEGGRRNFTLTVAEAGRGVPKTVSVSLVVRPRPTGIAVFFVEDGRLRRLDPDNAKDYANHYYAGHKEGGFPDGSIDFAAVTELKTALDWLNLYAKGGSEGAWSEYLVRVEKDEVLPKTSVHCYGPSKLPTIDADYVKIRIRGYGEERTITHDVENDTPLYFVKPDSSDDFDRIIAMGDGFLNVGLGTGQAASNGLNHIALYLEDKITVDAAGGTDLNFPGLGPNIRDIISVGKNGIFVMEEGSRLTNYVQGGSYTGVSVSASCAVMVYAEGRFEMNGGEITNIKSGPNVICLDNSNAIFVYRAGAISGNDSNLVGTRTASPSLRPYYHQFFRPAE